MTKAKIGMIADLHVGNHRKWGVPSRGLVAPINTRARETLSVLMEARAQAEVAGVQHLLVLGDVFDVSDPPPQLVAEVQAALESSKLHVHLMIGNHDQVSDQRGDHALVSMHGWRNLSVIERPEVLYLDGWQVHAIPYRPGRADDYLPGEMADLLASADGLKPGAERLLTLHLGMRDAETEPWLRASHDSFEAAKIPRETYRATFAGNWHQRKVAAPGVLQVGALVPTGFDNPGFTGYGSLVTASDDGVAVAEIAGPRFIRALSLSDVRRALAEVGRRGSPHATYISARCRPDERDVVRELMELHGHDLYEVLTDKAAVEEAAREARTCAAYASSDSIQAAVIAYVDKMLLPAGVERGEVRAMAVDYVAGATS